LSPGSRVDVLAAGGSGDLAPARAGPAVEVVSDRPVLALPEEESSGGGEGGALIVVAATPVEARSLAGHAAGSRLSITIRG
ncbi:Flp pilus assembly protein CpaB, partial [Nocardiopsis dassonvillei]|nr:Flp pilus assembly protein CpaB [Nocardiopsis dassonvillei]